MIDFDICVLGAGPGGSTIAKKLAQLGFRVLIVEKEPFPRLHIGLSLTPGIHHWLEQLELTESIQEAGFNRASNSILLWENNSPLIKDFSSKQAGYHVDRGVFDAILLQSAVEAGAKLLQPCTLMSCKETSLGCWEIGLQQAAVSKLIRARFLVEASGRKSILKGTKTAYLPKTLATYAYWENSLTSSGYSFIEAGANEWFWGAPVANRGYLACIFSNPMDLRKASSIQHYYKDKIKEATLFKQLVKSNKLGAITVCDATAYVDENPVSNNAIKIGDAALSTDPLSSQGVQKAIKSAFQGAIVVNTLLKYKERSSLAITYYQNMINRERISNTKWTKLNYNRQNRYEGGIFWEERKDCSISDLEAEYTISLSKTDQLLINANAHFEMIPIVGTDKIEAIEGIFVAGNEEPLVYLQNTPIVPIIKKIHGNKIVESLKIISTSIPDANPMEVLKWLIYNKIICSLTNSY